MDRLPPDAAQGLTALLGHDRSQLLVLATWLWQRGHKPITSADLARDCLAIDPAHTPLTYRLLVRLEVLREERSGQGAKLDISTLLTVLNVVNFLIGGTSPPGTGEVETVLTVPAGLELPRGLAVWRSIADLIRTLIASAQDRVWLLSPFLDEAGVEHFLEPATTALRRGVRFTVITQHLQQVASANSRAVERLRRAAVMVAGQLRTFSAKEGQRLDERSQQPLLHAKVVIADGSRAYIGSANLTGHGLGDNLEIGLGLEGPKVGQLELLLQQLIASDWVEPIYLA